MKRKTLLQAAGSAMALPAWSSRVGAAVLPWETLRRELDGPLIALRSPLATCGSAAACDALFANLRNPYYIAEHPALTQTLGWLDAWTTAPSTYAVAAHHAGDVAAALAFAREHGLRVAVRGGGHSYLGTSNAAGSLLIWTRPMDSIAVGAQTVTLGSGVIWAHAYQAVTTQHGRYVQGGGCATVNVAGLVQSGGFGSFSKRFGTASGSLLAAELVTADGAIHHVDAAHEPELLWALKGGGGGTFGVVTQLTLGLHELPPYAGAMLANVTATSDQSFRALVRRFVAFYREALFNPHWGETAGIRPDNVFSIAMVAQGLDGAEIARVWEPFFSWVKSSPRQYTLASEPLGVAIPARHWWDRAYWSAHYPAAIQVDARPGHGGDWWWAGDGQQVGWYLADYGSAWLPATLLDDSHQESLADALFTASRRFSYSLHFNKGLAGAPADALERARNSAMHPSVRDAFALAISGDARQGVFPGIAGHEPDLVALRRSARAVDACIGELRAVAPGTGSYLSETSYFQADWQRRLWGAHYPRLAAIKQHYDPHGRFAVHHGVV